MRFLPLALAITLSPVILSSQGKPVPLVQPFKSAPEVVLPYDLKQLQAQIVAEFRVMLGKDFEIASEPPAPPHGRLYTLNVEITRWQAGNAATRLLAVSARGGSLPTSTTASTMTQARPCSTGATRYARSSTRKVQGRRERSAILSRTRSPNASRTRSWTSLRSRLEVIRRVNRHTSVTF
jgi:hypothetical protein